MAVNDAVQGGILGGFSVAVMAFVRSLFKISKRSDSIFEKRMKERDADVSRARRDRDYEREEKHDWVEYATKLMYYIEDEHRQISRYLQDHKLDPTRFVFREIPAKRKNDKTKGN